jgi:hypothetical protein
MVSQREEKILENARRLRQKEHRLRPSLRLHTIRDAEVFIESHGLVSVLGGNELPSIISAYLGREWKPSGKGFTSWLDWWSLKVSGQHLGRVLSQLDRARSIVPTRIFRKSKTLISRRLLGALDPIVRHFSILASKHEIFSQQEWTILDFIQDNGPVRTDKLRQELGLRGKNNTTLFHTSLKKLESYALVIGIEDPHPEKHLHANVWHDWATLVVRTGPRREFSYQDSVEQLLSKTMDAVILVPEREVGKWFLWKQSALEAKAKLLDSGGIIQAGNFLVTPRVLNL